MTERTYVSDGPVDSEQAKELREGRAPRCRFLLEREPSSANWAKGAGKHRPIATR
jgi:hypothetical protein